MIAVDSLLILVCEALNVPQDCILNRKSHKPELCDARSLHIFFADKEGHARKDIAASLGYKKPSNLGYHITRIKELVRTDRAVQKAYALCSEKLKSYREAVA